METWRKVVVGLAAALAALVFLSWAYGPRPGDSGSRVAEVASTNSTLKAQASPQEKVSERLYRYRFVEGQTEDYVTVVNMSFQDPYSGKLHQVEFQAVTRVKVENVLGQNCSATVAYTNPSVVVAGGGRRGVPTLVATQLRGNNHGFSLLDPTTDTSAIVLARLGDVVFSQAVVDDMVGLCLSAPGRQGQRLEPSSIWSGTETAPSGFVEFLFADSGFASSDIQGQDIDFKESVEIVDLDLQDDVPAAELDWTISFPIKASMKEDLAPLFEAELGGLASYGLLPEELTMTHSVDGQTEAGGRTVVRLEDSWPKQAFVSVVANSDYTFSDYSTEVFDPADLTPFTVEIKLEASLVSVGN